MPEISCEISPRIRKRYLVEFLQRFFEVCIRSGIHGGEMPCRDFYRGCLDSSSRHFPKSFVFFDKMFDLEILLEIAPKMFWRLLQEFLLGLPQEFLQRFPEEFLQILNEEFFQKYHEGFLQGFVKKLPQIFADKLFQGFPTVQKNSTRFFFSETPRETVQGVSPGIIPELPPGIGPDVSDDFSVKFFLSFYKDFIRTFH